jgi:CO/xanthine dehydrogenase FAD-binding subunit
LRMIAAEKALIGRTPSSEVQAHALDEMLREAHFRTSLHRASAEYRRHLAGVLLEEALTKAWQRAK